MNSNQVKILERAWANIEWSSLTVKSPITAKQLAAIDIKEKVGRVQFETQLTKSDHLKLAERLRQFPEIYLRPYELFGTPEKSLDFLQHYKGLQRLSVDLYNLPSLKGIEHVVDSLEYLTLGKTKEKMSVEFLAGCGRLKGLFLNPAGS
jgi:hypothetical protein